MQILSASQQPCPPLTPGMLTKCFLSPAADNDGHGVRHLLIQELS